MSRTVLISTLAEDVHAMAIAHALERKQAKPILWFTPDFPHSACETVAFDGSGAVARFATLDVRLEKTGIDSFWNRRDREGVDHERIHPADRGFVRLQCSRFREGLLDLISQRVTARGGLCVNPWREAIRAENKLFQQAMALEAGLDLPATVITNDPDDIRRFLYAQGGAIVYKPFQGAIWGDGAVERGYFTNVIRADDLVDEEQLMAAPGIYQEVVPKAFELRVTAIGNRFFAAKIDSQRTANGKTDWRRAYEDLTMEPTSLPEEVEARCRNLMRSMGLCSGCLDFIVTPEGRYVFLEVNQGGQFLFVEEYSGLPLVDAFAEFLLQGHSDYQLSPGRTIVRFEDIVEEVSQRVDEMVKIHVETKPVVVDEVKLGS